MSRIDADIDTHRKSISATYPSAPSFLDGRNPSSRFSSSHPQTGKPYKAVRAKSDGAAIFDFDSIAQSDVSMPSWLDDRYPRRRPENVSRHVTQTSAYHPSSAVRAPSRGYSSYADARGSYDPLRSGHVVKTDHGRGYGTAGDHRARLDVDAGRKKTAAPADLRAERREQSRRDRLHRKADRQFAQTVGADAAPVNENAPRAGLYKGEMGRTHKKSARMQQKTTAKSAVGKTARVRFSLSSLRDSPRLLTAVVATLCLALAIGFVYPAAKDSYTAVRQKDQLAAEYQAIQDRNVEIQDRIDALNTPEGIEDKAHSDLGWVKEGENSVSVSRDGSSVITTDADDQTASIATGSVPAPTTWYSPVLDVLFGYSS